ncbi:MAG: MBL fold metallo-hydrolase [Alphaproteobacteria bacterium]|nr:MBL fold metallo-hydrolase [Alphaproteobacteria bacterium]
MLTILMTALSSVASADTPPPPIAAPAQELLPDIFLLPGASYPSRGPDGNTVVFVAPAGLVVVDTGRHIWHSQGILNFASGKSATIAAIVNTHWHLDHSSGNGRLRAVFPNAPLYASSAIDKALTGFLARSAQDTRERLASGSLNEVQTEEAQNFLATMTSPQMLRPDIVIAQSSQMSIAGREFDVHLAQNAATDGDVWLFDKKNRIAVVGDLVTLPAPYLDTACPGGWSKALDEIEGTPFDVAIPGHGRPMTHDQFVTYRSAFRALIECANAATDSNDCAASWVRNVGVLLGADEAMHQRALLVSESYIRFLRKNGGKSPDCQEATSK